MITGRRVSQWGLLTGSAMLCKQQHTGPFYYWVKCCKKNNKNKTLSQHTLTNWMSMFHLWTSSEKSSRRRTLCPSALHFAVLKFFHDLPLVSCGAMAVRVQLDLPLGSPFAASVARVFHQIIVIVLIVICLFKRDQSLDICRHLETEYTNNSSSFSVRSGESRIE